MATISYVKGHNLRVYAGTVAVGNATSCTLKITVDTKEISDKDVDPGAVTPSAVAIILGKTRANMTVSGFVVESNDGTIVKAGGYRTHLNNILAGSKLTWKFTTDVTGDTVVSMDGYISDFGANAEDGSEGTYNIDVKSTGPITSSIKGA
jgi:hypothetical protein